jgi:hypothetical protein
MARLVTHRDRWKGFANDPSNLTWSNEHTMQRRTAEVRRTLHAATILSFWFVEFNANPSTRGERGRSSEPHEAIPSICDCNVCAYNDLGCSGRHNSPKTAYILTVSGSPKEGLGTECDKSP